MQGEHSLAYSEWMISFRVEFHSSGMELLDHSKLSRELKNYNIILFLN